jgi:hypothetical protein
MSTSHSFRWSDGQAKVLATAAMLDSCVFSLPNGHFTPFARAPWMGMVKDTSIVGHLRELGGDFVGIPFGTGRPMPDAPPEWAALMQEPALHPIHGPSGDDDWTITETTDSSVTLVLDYPDDSPVLRLERVVAGRPGEPAIDFTLRVFARRKADLSLGLHPNFRLPESAGRLKLDADFAFGLVYPTQAARGQQEFSDLASVPQPGGKTIDFSHVPLSPKADRLVQLCGMRGPLTGTYLDEGAGFVLDWDRAQLPSLHIWHTDGGIGGEPWNNQFRGIGLEPLASAFDLNTAQSARPNPINTRGVATTVTIDPAAPLVVRHSVRAFAT